MSNNKSKNIIIKTPEQIAKMRMAGRLAADVLDMIAPFVKLGVTTDYLNTLCHDYIVNVQKAIPAPLDYHGFPKSICTSVNHVICHGIPSDKILKDSDIINIDITVIKDGYHGDTSRMFFIGKSSIKSQRLVNATYESMYKGIEQVKEGNTFGDIGYAIANYIKDFNYSVVEDFCGHGIGEGFHEEPQVLHYGKKSTGAVLKAGMIFTIEPMINIGKKKLSILKDGWTAVTKDRSLSAQFEHTILVTKDGYEILTLSQAEREKFEKNEK